MTLSELLQPQFFYLGNKFSNTNYFSQTFYFFIKSFVWIKQLYSFLLKNNFFTRWIGRINVHILQIAIVNNTVFTLPFSMFRLIILYC